MLSDANSRQKINDADINFAPLVSDMQTDKPINLDYIKTNTLEDRTDTLGVYVIVMEMPGSRPAIYIGSGTSSVGGIRRRLAHYRNPHCHTSWKLLPPRVKDRLNEGYTISHIGVLCETPSQYDPDNVTIFKSFVLVVETMMCSLLWTFQRLPEHEDAPAIPHMCPWALPSFFDGLNARAAWIESTNKGHRTSTFILTDEQYKALEAEAKAKVARILEKRYAFLEENDPEYLAMIRHSATKMAWKRAHYQKKKRTIRKQDQALRARKKVDKVFYCDTCHIPFCELHALTRHLGTAKHAAIKNGSYIPPGNWCDACRKAWANSADLTSHYKTQEHEDNVAAREGRQPRTMDTIWCPYCDRDFPLVKMMSLHVKKCHSESDPVIRTQTFHCGICPDLHWDRRHDRDKHIEKSYTHQVNVNVANGLTPPPPPKNHCRICGLPYKTTQALKTHYNKFHPGVNIEM